MRGDVAQITVVHDRRDPQTRRYLRSLVPARIVNQDDLVDDVERQFGVSLLESAGSVVRRQYDDDALALNQDNEASISSCFTC